jgi:hypothetical protein
LGQKEEKSLSMGVAKQIKHREELERFERKFKIISKFANIEVLV